MPLIGGVLTLLGFALGTGPWGWVVLAAFLVTLATGLVAWRGTHALVHAYMLGSWFIICLCLADGYQRAHVSSPAWAQTVAWLAGAAAWIVYLSVVWHSAWSSGLLSGRP